LLFLRAISQPVVREEVEGSTNFFSLFVDRLLDELSHVYLFFLAHYLLTYVHMELRPVLVVLVVKFLQINPVAEAIACLALVPFHSTNRNLGNLVESNLVDR
jgi:hypothetical protein